MRRTSADSSGGNAGACVAAGVLSWASDIWSLSLHAGGPARPIHHSPGFANQVLVQMSDVAHQALHGEALRDVPACGLAHRGAALRVAGQRGDRLAERLVAPRAGSGGRTRAVTTSGTPPTVVDAAGVAAAAASIRDTGRALVVRAEHRDVRCRGHRHHVATVAREADVRQRCRARRASASSSGRSAPSPTTASRTGAPSSRACDERPQQHVDALDGHEPPHEGEQQLALAAPRPPPGTPRRRPTSASRNGSRSRPIGMTRNFARGATPSRTRSSTVAELTPISASLTLREPALEASVERGLRPARSTPRARGRGRCARSSAAGRRPAPPRGGRACPAFAVWVWTMSGRRRRIARTSASERAQRRPAGGAPAAARARAPSRIPRARTDGLERVLAGADVAVQEQRLVALRVEPAAEQPDVVRRAAHVEPRDHAHDSERLGGAWSGAHWTLDDGGCRGQEPDSCCAGASAGESAASAAALASARRYGHSSAAIVAAPRST